MSFCIFTPLPFSLLSSKLTSISLHCSLLLYLFHFISLWRLFCQGLHRWCCLNDHSFFFLQEHRPLPNGNLGSGGVHQWELGMSVFLHSINHTYSSIGFEGANLTGELPLYPLVSQYNLVSIFIRPPQTEARVKSFSQFITCGILLCREGIWKRWQRWLWEGQFVFWFVYFYSHLKLCNFTTRCHENPTHWIKFCAGLVIGVFVKIVFLTLLLLIDCKYMTNYLCPPVQLYRTD